ncbi:unnamed protein product [Owenia fusiformis]|uniref:Uncharacterized protein n=1 Tax=Owenia fusiformis TaxID=6347 RepID=A0A8S4MZ77_OWEFU|nr:unnamed protein product [Owenia fusiformis]
MDKDIYFYLSSTDSTNIYPNNTASEFTVKLPRYFYLKGKWKIGLVDIQLPPLDSNDALLYLDVFCDLCIESVVDGNVQPILRRIPKDYSWLSFNQVLYKDVGNWEFDRIHVYIRGNGNTLVSFKDKPLTCTLHLKQVS